MKQFKCVKAWARNNVGDIVENYMMARYPKEIRLNHFVEIKPSTAKKKTTAKSSPKPASKSLSKGSVTSTDKS